MFVVERRSRVAVGDADDRLGGQVEYRVHLVLAENPLERAWSHRSPADDVARRAVPLRTSSDCGTQSRTRHVTSAPSSSSRGTSQLPTRPVPPVTNVGRSRQNGVTARPLTQRADRPEPVQVFVVAMCPQAAELRVFLTSAKTTVSPGGA